MVMRENKGSCVYSGGEIPESIPNSVVKPASGDGTALRGVEE